MSKGLHRNSPETTLPSVPFVEFIIQTFFFPSWDTLLLRNMKLILFEMIPLYFYNVIVLSNSRWQNNLHD